VMSSVESEWINPTSPAIKPSKKEAKAGAVPRHARPPLRRSNGFQNAQ
jgi:hypothetical protein